MGNAIPNIFALCSLLYVKQVKKISKGEVKYILIWFENKSFPFCVPSASAGLIPTHV